MDDEGWRRHASDCSDCNEYLLVGRWMSDLAAATPAPLALPSSGFLLAKSQIRQRFAAAETAGRPVRIMVRLTAVILTIAIIAALGMGTRTGMVMIDGLALLSSYAVWFILATILVIGVYGVAAYFVRHATERDLKL